jgi:hypothetical protein
MWNMRKIHFSHCWKTPAAEPSVKAARFVRAASAVGAKRRAFTDDGAEGTRVSAKKPDSPRLSTNNDDESRFFLIKPHRPCAAKE